MPKTDQVGSSVWGPKKMGAKPGGGGFHTERMMPGGQVAALRKQTQGIIKFSWSTGMGGQHLTDDKLGQREYREPW